jgi:hypothetical protein
MSIQSKIIQSNAWFESRARGYVRRLCLIELILYECYFELFG